MVMKNDGRNNQRDAIIIKAKIESFALFVQNEPSNINTNRG